MIDAGSTSARVEGSVLRTQVESAEDTNDQTPLSLFNPYSLVVATCISRRSLSA